jgi:hypothetical protein
MVTSTTKMGAALLFLAVAGACGQAAGPDRVKEKRPIDLDPGTWRSEIRLVESRGMPDWSTQSQNEMLARLSGLDRCMPPEAARNANLHETLTKGPWRGGNCAFSRKSVTDSGVDIAMSCEGMTPTHRLETTVSGTASPKKSDLTIENRSRNPINGAEIYEKYRIVSTWQAPACRRGEKGE